MPAEGTAADTKAAVAKASDASTPEPSSAKEPAAMKPEVASAADDFFAKMKAEKAQAVAVATPAGGTAADTKAAEASAKEQEVASAADDFFAKFRADSKAKAKDVEVTSANAAAAQASETKEKAEEAAPAKTSVVKQVASMEVDAGAIAEDKKAVAAIDKEVMIAGHSFSNRDGVKKYVEAIQESAADSQALPPEHALFMFYLASYLPDFESKLSAPVVGFKYGLHSGGGGGLKCFFYSAFRRH
jgi:hypothetical protein